MFYVKLVCILEAWGMQKLSTVSKMNAKSGRICEQQLSGVKSWQKILYMMLMEESSNW